MTYRAPFVDKPSAQPQACDPHAWMYFNPQQSHEGGKLLSHTFIIGDRISVSATSTAPVPNL